MILKSIELHNYRLYYGKVLIEFATGEKNITIVEGDNDAGKTSLLNAFTWCLYGEESYRKKGKEEKWNKAAVSELNIDDFIDVEVEIKMIDNENHEIIFKRKQTFKKISEKKCVASIEDFKIFKNDGLNDVEIFDTNQYMETHLPRELKEYFLFNGEYLIQFFNNTKTVKDAVFNLSHLNLLENTEKHLGITRDKLLKEQEKIAPKLTKLLKNKKDLEDSLKQIKIKIVDNEKSISLLNNKNIELHEKLEKYNPESEELHKEKQQLLKINDEYEIKLLNKNNDFLSYLTKNLTYVLGKPLLDEYINKASDLEEKGYIPIKFKTAFLEELLSKNICICGTKLEENTECYENIIQLIKNTDNVTNISEEVNQLLSISRLVRNTKYPKTLTSNLAIRQNSIKDIESDIEHNKRRINEINLILKDSPVEIIQEINNEIKHNENSITKYNQNIGALKQQASEIPQKINEINLEISKEKINEDLNIKLAKQIDFCENLEKICANLNKDMQNYIHNKLQDLTAEEFKKIHWKESYSDILINKNFDVLIEKEDGYQIEPTDMSSGSQLALALSFILALNSLSGFKLPIIIDTPLGILGDKIRITISDIIPEALKEKQIALFCTDKEYEGKFKENIDFHVGKKYDLIFTRENGEKTSVHRVI